MTVPEDLTCRLADHDDLPALLALIPQIERDSHAAGAQVPTLERARAIFAEMVRQGNMFVFVATLPNETGTGEPGIVGTCTLAITPSLAHGGRPSATIEAVVVATQRRGRGLGKALMACAIAHAREAGCYKAQLITRGRPDQVGFYRQAGFPWEGVGFKVYF